MPPSDINVEQLQFVPKSCSIVGGGGFKAGSWLAQKVKLSVCVDSILFHFIVI